MPASLPAQLSRAAANSAAQVLPALSQAAARTGIDFSALFNTARLESGFNPEAKARTSSATGLFQFIDSTWLSTLAKHGTRHGITPGTRTEALALRKNPEIASLMAAEHMAENKASLEARLGRETSPAELYLAHFLGSGGALKFLSNLAANPAQAAASLMPAAARANRAIFFSGQTPRSLADVQRLLETRFTGTSAPPASAATGTPHPVIPAQSETYQANHSANPNQNPATQARLAAQTAYLLLADLGA